MKTALILIDHGSRNVAANELLEELTRRTRARGVYDIVELAHMEIAKPTLKQAFAACVAQGATRIVVHPYFLSPGRHSQVNIPEQAREAAAAYPHVEVFVTQPLGLDDRLIDLVLRRADEALREGDPIAVTPETDGANREATT